MAEREYGLTVREARHEGFVQVCTTITLKEDE